MFAPLQSKKKILCLVSEEGYMEFLALLFLHSLVKTCCLKVYPIFEMQQFVLQNHILRNYKTVIYDVFFNI